MGVQMVAVVALGPVPTVHLFVRVPVALTTGGWTWGEHSALPGALAKDFAYDADECAALVHTYGRTLTRIMTRRQIGVRFTICARGPVTGLVLGLREWEWSADLGDYRRVGEYMCGWREASRAYYLRTGQFVDRARFKSPAAVAVCHQPLYSAA